MTMDKTAGQPPSQPLLTVIIPVYNVEPYLRRCLDSICGQSYRHLEIICVDDGSTDGSLAILREYEARDGRVRVVTQPNSRQARARNVALDMARGEWVTGVDSDDYMQPDSYLRAMAHATAEVDAVCFGMKVEAEPGLEGRVAGVHRFSNFKYEGLRELDAKCITGIAWYFVNKIYRRALIEEHGLRFDASNCGCEDMRFHMCFCACARKVYFLREELYVYALRQGSTCHSVSQAELRVRSYVSCFDGVLEAYRRHRGLEASLPMLQLLQTVMFRDSAPWAFRCGMALECRRLLLAVAAKYGLQRMPALAPALYEFEEQLRWAQRAVDVLRACAAAQPAAEEAAEATACSHVALPADEACAPMALELVRELRGCAAARPLCIHVLADALCPATCARFEALAAGEFRVSVHAVDAAMLHSLPPLEAGSPYLGYLRMALPLLLPSLGRVLLLSPTLSVDGELPDWDAVPMEGLPLAALPRAGAAGYELSSVLLADLARLREERGAETWLAACLFRPHCPPDVEVEAFATAFEGKVAALTPEPWQGFRPVPPAEHRCCPEGEGALWVGLPLDAARAEDWSPLALPAELLLLQHGLIRRRYWGCRLASLLLSGRRRRRAQVRCREYRALLERIRALRADIRRRLPR